MHHTQPSPAQPSSKRASLEMPPFSSTFFLFFPFFFLFWPLLFPAISSETCLTRCLLVTQQPTQPPPLLFPDQATDELSCTLLRMSKPRWRPSSFLSLAPASPRVGLQLITTDTGITAMPTTQSGSLIIISLRYCDLAAEPRRANISLAFRRATKYVN